MPRSTAAQRHGIRLMFVLLDFLWCHAARTVRGVQLGAEGAGARRTQTFAPRLLEDVLRPVLERYGDDPSIFAWDIINEPEWIKTVSQEQMRGVSESERGVDSLDALFIRRPSGPLAPDGATDTKDSDWIFTRCTGTTASSTSLRSKHPWNSSGSIARYLLGEFPTRGSRKSREQIVEAARVAGYSGAFYWSVLAKDDCSATIDD